MTTRNLVQNHAKVIHLLDSKKLLQGKTCNFIRLPFESYDTSVFHEIKRGGKSVLTNDEGEVVQFADINVERAMLLAIVHDEKTKTKTVSVKNNDEQPNVVFFQIVDGINTENAALVTDISFQLWYLIKTKQLTNKQLQQMLKKLTAVLIAHTKKNDMPGVTKTLLYTNPENGEFLAPLAALQDNLSKEVLDDFKVVIDTGDLPATVQPVSTEHFTQMRKSTKDYKNRAIGDLREAVYDSKNSKQAAKRAQDILKKYFNMNLVQALDLMHLNNRQESDDHIDLAEDLINNTLRYIAQENPSQDYAEQSDIVSEQLVDAFSNRLA